MSATESNNDCILKVSDLHVAYGSIQAIKGINFEVKKGEVVSLIGANGAGKTTTMKAMSGLLPCRGRIEFKGQVINSLEPHQRVPLGLAQSPEGRGVFPDMTVHENLEMGAYFRKGQHAKIKEDIEECFKLFPRLRERDKQYAGTLSGGEQQMLAMCRALMSKPDLLLLDEPSLGLAPLVVAQIFEIIKKLNKSGMTVLLVEQNARMALQVSDRAYVIETGKITLSGRGEDLLNDDAVRRSYLGV